MEEGKTSNPTMRLPSKWAAWWYFTRKLKWFNRNRSPFSRYPTGNPWLVCLHAACCKDVMRRYERGVGAEGSLALTSASHVRHNTTVVRFHRFQAWAKQNKKW